MSLIGHLQLCDVLRIMATRYQVAIISLTKGGPEGLSQQEACFCLTSREL